MSRHDVSQDMRVVWFLFAPDREMLAAEMVARNLNSRAEHPAQGYVGWISTLDWEPDEPDDTPPDDVSRNITVHATIPSPEFFAIAAALGDEGTMHVSMIGNAFSVEIQTGIPPRMVIYTDRLESVMAAKIAKAVNILKGDAP
jgi:hypothetical protein